MIQLDRSFVWCWKLNTWESIPEVPWMFLYVVLEKDVGDNLDWSCEKWSIRWNLRRKGILQTITRRKANSVGHVLRRNCLLNQVIEGKMEWSLGVVEMGIRRRKQPLDELKEMTGYCKIKEKALNRRRRTRCRRGYGPVVRQTIMLTVRH